MRTLLARIALPVLLVGAAWAQTRVESFSADLVPTDPQFSSASGRAEFVLEETGPFDAQISYTLTVEGLSSPELAAHVHDADGEILHFLPLGSPKIGVWTDPGPLASFQLRRGELFVLVHTEARPGGEVRGDLRAALVPVRPARISQLKRAYAGPRPD